MFFVQTVMTDVFRNEGKLVVNEPDEGSDSSTCNTQTVLEGNFICHYK